MDQENIVRLFQEGYDCSQVVLSHYADRLGISEETANRVSACFGGGMGCGETCGVLTGALMVLGLKYGHWDSGHMDQKAVMAEKRARFLHQVREKYPSLSCKDILGHDITVDGEMQKVLDQGLLFTLCPRVLADVIGILDRTVEG